nr:uncharacterized protein LOC116426299 [Nomia melanderi]
MTFDKPGCLNKGGLCSHSCDHGDLIKTVEKLKPPFFVQLTSQVFNSCCTGIRTAKIKLDMRGSIVFEKIKRVLEDMDIPVLIIFLQKHQDIRCINLAGNNISDNGFKNLIDHLLVHKHVDDLDIGNNNIKESGINYLLEVGEGIQIKSLSLRMNKLSVKASMNVAKLLLQNEHLLHLNVADVDQTASSLIYFIMVLSQDQKDYNETLKCLDISRPNPGCMYYFDSVHFASVIGHMLKHNSTLTTLHLQKYNFSCHDIETMMSNAIFNNTLLLLDLGCNNIGDHGVDHLAKWLAKRPKLKNLILCKNIITDHGARILSFALPFSKLLSLDISYNKITDNGMVEFLYTLKKNPLLRQLKIFGNSIDHLTAKIIKRMLISKVLNQENIDIRLYKVDHRWCIARYEDNYPKKGYHDVSYGLFSQASDPPIKKSRPKAEYYKYTYNRTKEINVQHSAITIISNILDRDHQQDCRCCYSFRCEAPHYDEQCRNFNHPETCTCCKCKGGESSDWSVDHEILKRIKPPLDVMEKITHILKNVSSDIGKSIIRWINIDEDILEEDLKVIAGQDKSDENSPKDSCNCSWAQFSISSLQKYLEESSSQNILIIPKDNPLLTEVNKRSESSTSISSKCMSI